MRDLWPDDIAYVKTKAPVAILREQASLLGQKTQNLVEAKVETQDSIQPEIFAYNFYIVAPALGYYRFLLFTIAHSIELYPLEMRIDEKIFWDVFSDASVFSIVDEEKLKIGSEDEFLQVLKKIFDAGKTRRIISVLLAQASSDSTQGE